MWITVGISILTLGLVLTRPRPLNEATAAAIGAVLMVVLQRVSLPQTLDVLQANINVLLFFLGLMAISAVAEQAGIFEWGAQFAVRFAGRNGTGLIITVIILGAIVTAFLSNDATALVLTPVVFTLVSGLKLNPLPYMFATAFIANTASLLLPVSNPVNLLAVDAFSISLKDYLRYLFVPGLVAILINTLLFIVIFKKDIKARFSIENIQSFEKHDKLFRFTGIVLGITAVAYLALSHYALPLSLAAIGGAVILLSGGFVWRRLDWKGVRSRISWSILVFIFCLAVVVRGLENSGVIRVMTETLLRMVSDSGLAIILSLAFGTALGSNLINNWSMMMVSVSSLQSVGPFISLHPGAPYAVILGAALGPNLTIIGSLSSMLWLVLLRQRGLSIHPMTYFKLGLVVMPPMVLVGALMIYMISKM